MYQLTNQIEIGQSRRNFVCNIRAIFYIQLEHKKTIIHRLGMIHRGYTYTSYLLILIRWLRFGGKMDMVCHSNL